MHRMFDHPIALLLVVLASAFATASPLAAQGVPGLLPVEKAYQVQARVTSPGVIGLHFTIAPDYYLYRSRFRVSTLEGHARLGALQLPDGLKEHDPYLGDIEIYHHSVDASVPYTLLDPKTRQLELSVRMQGCHEVEPKICYPPYTVKLQVPIPKGDVTTSTRADALQSAFSGTGNWLAQRGTTNDNKPGTPLPADQAFRFDAIVASPDTLLLRWSMPKGYYLYRDRTTLRLLDAHGARLGTPRWPTGVAYHDDNFGDSIVYFDQVEVPVPIVRGKRGPVKLQASFQGCLEHSICYPVMTRTLTLDLSGMQAAAAPGSVEPVKTTGGETVSGGLIGALLLALAGGLLLNLMPCVLPVLSLKAVHVLESRESTRKTRHHALAYTAGVLVSFAIVGLAVIGLRMAGMASGWGFQLQQPVFVAALAYVMLAMGLSYSGVVHFGAGLAGTGQSLTTKTGLTGDFFTGVLAVVVASPCTAPLMGVALAYAFTASWPAALSVFLMLGVGLALPFLLLGFVPRLGAWLPRPGAWMDTLKQVLAFPLYLTAAWLAWVLTNQRGADAVGLLLVGAVLLGLALWWVERSRRRGLAARLVAALLVILAMLPLALIQRVPKPASAAAHAASANFVAYTPARLAQLRREGVPVLVDMTADWCITCKANEHLVLDTDAFRALLKRTGAVYMKGDWTNEDPAISAFLKRWHSPGVPVYVVFPKNGGPGRKLPTVLTMDTVRSALEKAAR